MLLAGGPADAVAALEPGAPNKAFVRVGGVTLAARTIAGLRACERIGRVVAVAPLAPAAVAALGPLVDELRPDGRSITESLRSGLAGLPPDEPVVVSASDLPLLDGASVAELVTLAERSGADLVYACVERAAHVARYPDVPHTWARLRGGSYCGGGAIVVRPRAFPALAGFLERLGSARKNPLALAAIFGPQVLGAYALGRLTVEAAERKASALLGAPAAAAICTRPEIAVNVDRPSDVALAERLVREVVRTACP